MSAADGVGPPGPDMRSPGGKPGQREMSISEPTDDIYPATAQLSSASVRPACAALSVGELSERTCRHVVYREEGICR